MSDALSDIKQLTAELVYAYLLGFFGAVLVGGAYALAFFGNGGLVGVGMVVLGALFNIVAFFRTINSILSWTKKE